MFLLFCGLSVVLGTGLKLLLRAANASTMAASRHPDHRPEVTSAYSQPCGTHWRFSAFGFAVRSGTFRKRQAQEIRDNRAIVTK